MSRTVVVNKNGKVPDIRIDSRYLNYINYILAGFLALILSVTPFLRGLYFRENYIPTAIFIGVAFILVLVKLMQERKCLVESYMDLALLGLTAAYLISFIFGISSSNSLDGLIKYISAFMIYRIAYELAKDSRIKVYLLDAVVLSGFVMALFSLLGSGGIVNINGVFGWGERLNGLYQYPNSTASILGGIFLLNIFLVIDKKNRSLRIAYFVSASTMMLTFLETRSRGAMLTVILAWVLAFLLSKAKDRLSLIAYSCVSVAIGFLFYSKIYNSFIEQENFAVLFVMFLAVSVVCGFVMELFVKKLETLEIKNINRVIIGLFVIVLLAAVAAFNITTPLELTAKQPHRGYEIYQVDPSASYTLEFTAESINNSSSDLNVAVNSVDRSKARTSLNNSNFALVGGKTYSVEFDTNESTLFITVDFSSLVADNAIRVIDCSIKDRQSGTVIDKIKLDYKFIPNDIAKKIDEISLKTESSSERFVFIKDGLKMLKDYFVTGTGAKGWSQLYTKYQSYGYVSREAHNYYLQTAIESGLVGMISLIALLICIGVAGIKLYIKASENSYLLVGMIAMLFELFAHAFLDFDFSMQAMFLTVMCCLGWLSSVAAQNGILTVNSAKGRKIVNYIALVVAVAFIALTATMNSGIKEGSKAASIVKTDFALARKHYESAISKDFFNSSYKVDYNQILTMEAQKTGDKELIERIYNSYKEVEKNDTYEARYYTTILNFYSMFGYFDDAAALLERQIEILPFKPESYELKATLSYQIMAYLINNKKYKEALKFNDSILMIEEQHREANTRTIAPFELTQTTKDVLTQTKAMRESLESEAK